MKNDSALFYTCSLIEFIGRRQKMRRALVVEHLGEDTLKRIYKYADIFHCEPIEKVADDFISRCNIPMDSFDNLGKCRYEIPDYWSVGEIYERLIEVYTSWIDSAISNYNTDFYYQSREYIVECYREGRVCA